MIGTRPVSDLALPRYRYALDAAMSALPCKMNLIVRCHLPELDGEIRQRIPNQGESGESSGALWIEPLADGWQAELDLLAKELPCSAPLVLIASRPLARVLPGRPIWTRQPIGFHPTGIRQLQRALNRGSFTLQGTYGIHSISAMGLDLISRIMEWRGRTDLGDRLHFAARLRYCSDTSLAGLSAVALMIALREEMPR